MAQSPELNATIVFDNSLPSIPVNDGMLKAMWNQHAQYTSAIDNTNGANSIEDAFMSYEANNVDIEMTTEYNVNDKKRGTPSSSIIERAVKRQVTDALGRATSARVSSQIRGHLYPTASPANKTLKHNYERKQHFKKARKDLDDAVKVYHDEREKVRGQLTTALHPLPPPFIQSASGYGTAQSSIKISKHRRTSSLSVTILNPSAASFYPLAPGFEKLDIQDTATWSSGASSGSHTEHPRPTSQGGEVQTQYGSAFSAPPSSPTIYIPIPIRSKPQSTTNTSSSISHPLPDLLPPRPSTPSLGSSADSNTPPSTPTLGSCTRFDDCPHRHKSKFSKSKSFQCQKSSRPPLPVVTKSRTIVNANPFIDLTFEDGNNTPDKYKIFTTSGTIEELKTDVGPYRKAAVWEFIGQTFEKVPRMEREGKKQKESQKHYAPGLMTLAGPSPLKRRVLTGDEEEQEELDLQIAMDWAAVTGVPFDPAKW